LPGPLLRSVSDVFPCLNCNVFGMFTARLGAVPVRGEVDVGPGRVGVGGRSGDDGPDGSAP
jgi:hypothetical protein